MESKDALCRFFFKFHKHFNSFQNRFRLYKIERGRIAICGGGEVSSLFLSLRVAYLASSKGRLGLLLFSPVGLHSIV